MDRLFVLIPMRFPGAYSWGQRAVPSIFIEGLWLHQDGGIKEPEGHLSSRGGGWEGGIRTAYRFFSCPQTPIQVWRDCR